MHCWCRTTTLAKHTACLGAENVQKRDLMSMVVQLSRYFNCILHGCQRQQAARPDAGPGAAFVIGTFYTWP